MRFIDSANEVLNEKLRQSHIAAHYLSLKESVDEKYINVFPERVQNYITKLALILSDLCEDEEVEKKDNYNNETYFLAAIEFLCLNLINNDYLHKTLKALNESGNRAKHTISEINLKSNMYKYVDAYNLMISELIDHTKLTSLAICKLNKKNNDEEKDVQPEVTAEVSDPYCSICGLMNLKSINIRYYKCRKCHNFVCVDCYSIEKRSCINCTKIKDFDYFLEKAEQGDASSQVKVANCYFTGTETDEDKEAAFKWFMKAAEQNEPDGQFMVGLCYYEGKGTEQNKEMSLIWYKKSAEQGNTEAQKYINEIENEFATVEQFKSQLKLAENGNSDSQYYVGDCYYNGKGTEKDLEKAFEWVKKSAEQGNSDAQYITGYCFYYGKGVEKNEENSLTWLYKSADSGNENAINMIKDCFHISKTSDGIILKYGNPSDISHESISASWNNENAIITAKNLKLNSEEHSGSLKIIFWFSEKENKFDNAYKMGETLFDEEGLSNGQYWEDLKEKIEFTGNPPTGEYYVAITINEYHEGGYQYIIDQAWFEKAYHWEHDEKKEFNKQLKLAENGDSEAQYQIGCAYYNGEGVKQNKEIAMSWYKKAAEHGNTEAQKYIDEIENEFAMIEQFNSQLKLAEDGSSDSQYYVGDSYYNGKGTEKDLEKAFEWFKKSAEQGNSDAQYMAGYCLCYGKGVVKNENDALTWLYKSADSGNEKASKMIINCFGISKRSDDIVIKHGDSSTITHESLSASWNSEEATVTTKNLKLNSEDHTGSLKMIFWFSNKKYSGKNGQLDDAYIMGEKIFWKNGLSKGQYWEELETKIDFAGNPPTGEYYVAITINEYNEDGNQYVIDKDWFTKTYHWEHSEKIEFNKNLKLAENGDSDAQRGIGLSYYYGNGIEKDLAKSFTWFLKSAKQGNPDSQSWVGNSLEFGYGTEKNLSEAYQWYKKAADNNDSFGQYSVGKFFEKGIAVDKDLNEAIKWYEKAANNNSIYAMNKMGEFYEEGIAVEKDMKQAFIYYEKSSANNNPYGQFKTGVFYFKGKGKGKNIKKGLELIQLAAQNNSDEAKKWLTENELEDITIKTGLSSNFSHDDAEASWNSNEINITIKNLSLDSEDPSGSLKVYVWFSKKQYLGEDDQLVDAYCMGEKILYKKSLSKGEYLEEVKETIKIINNPPKGKYYVAITINEYHEKDKWYIVDWLSFNKPFSWS